MVDLQDRHDTPSTTVPVTATPVAQIYPIHPAHAAPFPAEPIPLKFAWNDLRVLSGRTGISAHWLYRIFRRRGWGHKPPTPRIEDARKIADALGIELGYLYECLALTRGSAEGHGRVKKAEMTNGTDGQGGRGKQGGRHGQLKWQQKW